VLFDVAAQPAIGVVLYGTGLGLIVICTLPFVAAGAGAGEDGAGVELEGAVGDELSVVVHAVPAIPATHATIGNQSLRRFVGLPPVIVLNLLQTIVAVEISNPHMAG